MIIEASSILLNVPYETIFFCIARATDAQMVFKHDILGCPSLIILGTLINHEEHSVVVVENAI